MVSAPYQRKTATRWSSFGVLRKIVNAIHIDDSVIAQNPYSDGPK